MPLANRVDPFGTIHADPARGLFTGNRGIIHDPRTRTLLKRGWTTEAWIVCELSFGDRPPRDVMGRNARGGGAGWTELFFLDEVTALAAGHRPCFTCRRAAARRFAGAFAVGRDQAAMSAPAIDAVLHGERVASARKPLPVWAESLAALPDGAMIADKGAAFAKRGDRLLPWGFDGYGPSIGVADGRNREWRLATPRSTVAALRAGFRPLWHPSAG